MALPPRDPSNRYWPLPPDYGTLTLHGQRQARVDLLTGWYDLSKPGELITDRDHFIEAFAFYKAYYRKRARCNKHKYTCADAPMHREWIRRVAYHRRNVITAFRGSSKTGVLCEELPEMILVTRPYTPIQYVSAAADLTDNNVRAVQMSISENELIADDFGKLKPSRGSIFKWTQGHFELTNGSGMMGFTAFGTQRGAKLQSVRFRVQLLDDWERDSRVRNAELRSDAEDYLFNVLFPMGEPGAWIVWPNTLLHVQAWAMKATNHEDPRFDSWECGRWDADYFTEGPADSEGNPTVLRHSSWPARWSVEDLDAAEGTGSDRIVGLGAHSFGQEFRNRPGSKAGKTFEFDPAKHTFFWTGEGNKRLLHDVETGEDIPYEVLKERSIGVVGNDLALGKTRSDFCANVVGRLDDKGVLWILESWFARTSPMDALYQALTMGEFWEALAISVERVNFEQVAIDQLNEELNQRRLKNRYAPEVYVCNRAGAEAKKIRALRLQYRFREGLIKIATQGPGRFAFASGCSELLEQVQYFTYDGGNLRNDDLLDALVAVHEAFAGIGQVAFSAERAKGLIDQMRACRQQGTVLWPGAEHPEVSKIVDQTILDKERAKSREIDEEDLNSIASGYEADLSECSIFDFTGE